jgi:hypothetical protein
MDMACRIFSGAPPIAPHPWRSGLAGATRYAQSVNIEDFYAADERRRASTEIEFGQDWHDATKARFELSWVQDTGELYLMGEPTPSVYEDPIGDFEVDSMTNDELVVTVLGVVPTHEGVEEVLKGWAEAMAQPQGVEWLTERLRSAGVSA